MVKSGCMAEHEIVGKWVDVTGDGDHYRIKEAGKPLTTEGVRFFPVQYANGGYDIVRMVDRELDSFGRRGNGNGMGNPGVRQALEDCIEMPILSACTGGVSADLRTNINRRVNIMLYYVTSRKDQKCDALRVIGVPALLA